MIRLDKLLGHSGYGTRREIKSLCRRGDVTVNGIVVKDGAYKVDTAKDCVAVGCEAVAYEEFYYLMRPVSSRLRRTAVLRRSSGCCRHVTARRGSFLSGGSIRTRQDSCS